VILSNQMNLSLTVTEDKMSNHKAKPNYARQLERLAKASDGVLIYSW